MKLPDKWCVKRNLATYKEINAYFNKIFPYKTYKDTGESRNYPPHSQFYKSHDFIHYPACPSTVHSYIKPDYQEISYELFLEYIGKKISNLTDNYEIY